MTSKIKKYLVRYSWFRHLPVNIKLTCILYRDNGEWIARCLDLNLIATSTRKTEAINDLKTLITSQIQFVSDNNNWDYLFQSAPKEEWDRFKQMKRQCSHEKTKLATNSLQGTVDLCFV